MCKQKRRSPAEGNACNNSKQRQKCAVYLSDVRVLVCVSFPGRWRTLVFSARTQLWQRQHGPIGRAADKQTTAGPSLTLGLFPSLRPTFSSHRLATHFLLPRLRWLLGNRHNTTARLSTQRGPRGFNQRVRVCAHLYTELMREKVPWIVSVSYKQKAKVPLAFKDRLLTRVLTSSCIHWGFMTALPTLDHF